MTAANQNRPRPVRAREDAGTGTGTTIVTFWHAALSPFLDNPTHELFFCPDDFSSSAAGRADLDPELAEADQYADPLMRQFPTSYGANNSLHRLPPLSPYRRDTNTIST